MTFTPGLYNPFITRLYHIFSPSFYFRICRMTALGLGFDIQPPGHDVDEAWQKCTIHAPKSSHRY
jgi:hypothetical protein